MGSQRIIALACLECRQKHVKCDGNQPICTRCAKHRLICTFAPSRRGHNRRRGRSPPSPRPVGRPATILHHHPEDDTRRSHASTDTSSVDADLHVTSPAGLATSDVHYWTQVYYGHFHEVHPLLSEYEMFLSQPVPEYLRIIVCSVARVVKPEPAPWFSNFETMVAVTLTSSDDERTIHRVQALVLSAITLHTLGLTTQASSCIARAVQVALDLRLERMDVEDGDAGLDTSIRESARRTWWELYTADVFLAAVHRRPPLMAENLESHPHIPRTRSPASSGARQEISHPFASLERRRFTSGAPPPGFSPFSFWIDSAQLLKRTTLVGTGNTIRTDSVDAVDHALAAWHYHLPEHHQQVVNDLGSSDAQIFNAHMLVGCAKIMLHFPRSTLPLRVPNAAQIACVGRHALPALPESSSHTVKAIAASVDIVRLASLPRRGAHDSPYYTCCLILACIVQLASATSPYSSCDNSFLHHRDAIALLLGVLAQQGRIWTTARIAHEKLAGIATLILDTQLASAQAPNEVSFDTSAHDSAISMGTDSPNLSWFDFLSADDLLLDHATDVDRLSTVLPTGMSNWSYANGG